MYAYPSLHYKVVIRQLVQKRFCSTIQRNFQEIQIPMPWGHIAGKWWEPFNSRPIIALHGWQDNCGSFDRLIPLLTRKVGVLALDLPGHGLSSRLPPGMFYHNMNYPIILRQITSYFDWQQVSLMGHSLGAISSYIYTMIFPESVDLLLCIDGMQPLFKKDNAPRMAIGLDEHLKYDRLAHQSNDEEPPSYSLEEMALLLSEANNGSISVDHVGHILCRNSAPSKKNPGKYYFTRDPRLKSRFILNWDEKELVAAAKRITCPLIMCKATKSGYFGEKKSFEEVFDVVKTSSKDCQYHEIEGSHHLHLNNPETVAIRLNPFIEKYQVKDENNPKLLNKFIVR